MRTNEARPAPVMFDSTDALCFDDERLVDIVPGEYRTKRDIGSKFIVTATDSRGPVSFQVFREDGLIEHTAPASMRRANLKGSRRSQARCPGKPRWRAPPFDTNGSCPRSPIVSEIR